MTTEPEPDQITIPEGYTLHTENTARILLPPGNQAFLNPVQEFNRDLSVACIRTWSELLNEEKAAKWRQNQEKRAKKAERGPKAKRVKTEGGATAAAPAAEGTPGAAGESSINPEPSEPALVEAVAGPSNNKQPEYQPYRSVILEALSATGLRSIRYAKEIPHVKYVVANDLSSSAVEAMKRNVEINGLAGQDPSNTEASGKRENGSAKPQLGKVRVHESDACALMYNHRTEKTRVDVVDLDPYGTAAPFIDAAVQCVQDGGLLCITCTDLAVLATVNYPEKCFSNYGGVPLKAEYCHEAALRLVLHSLSTSATRYGRYIQPLLSLSIDFYVRVFVRVFSVPNEVKKAMRTDVVGPIHDPSFIGRGMLSVAKEELPLPFYFTPSRVAGHFHCICPSLDEAAQRTFADVFDIFRLDQEESCSDGQGLANSPTFHLLSKEPKAEANFKHHPQSVTSSSKIKIVRYQNNPTPHWGPAKKAGSGSAPSGRENEKATTNNHIEMQ
ncbi:N2,N2-dimethylguanosine tRNA methyltransferase-domain-containing protein [Fomitopsis serialis]|uniref:N2,N2-dimethylguanosine tRNA methyltransferase-domain-containing protein n=1 Tax=Fomitopsis serialis TaxID=139415 RepID=UPI0020086E09|nr:N2,N2-dimethylguanosine tRNA methyltransferase-domain-containing protein [Neoantrodia serialis]KAH9926196.1 N2,N2-dimethylguanosine tRNA methyltransferase-domain-containing protein [Neoantrodia serialis]